MRGKNQHSLSRKALVGTERGIALLAVLWLVAALSIMITGLQKVVRGEIQIASQFRNSVIGEGLADAAIRLTLQDLTADKSKTFKSIKYKTVSVFGSDISVEIIPLNGYIDMNSASVGLLADTFEYGGGLSKEVALRLAVSAVEARDQKSVSGVPLRFHAIEDLLRLPGVDYDVYAKIKSYLTADIASSGRVNPLAASEGVLAILAKGNLAQVTQLLESRRSSPESIDTTALTANHIDMAPTSYLLIRAVTVAQDNINLARTWRVDLSAPSYGLPWRVLGIDPSVVVAARQAQ
jgi:general secretion pathway protein K